MKKNATKGTYHLEFLNELISRHFSQLPYSLKYADLIKRKHTRGFDHFNSLCIELNVSTEVKYLFTEVFNEINHIKKNIEKIHQSDHTFKNDQHSLQRLKKANLANIKEIKILFYKSNNPGIKKEKTISLRDFNLIESISQAINTFRDEQLDISLNAKLHTKDQAINLLTSILCSKLSLILNELEKENSMVFLGRISKSTKEKLIAGILYYSEWPLMENLIEKKSTGYHSKRKPVSIEKLSSHQIKKLGYLVNKRLARFKKGNSK